MKISLPELRPSAHQSPVAGVNRVLEVFKDGNDLAMSLYADRDFSSTVRHYSRVTADFAELRRLTQETAELLNRAGSDGMLSRSHFQELKKTARILWDSLIDRRIKDELSVAGGALVLFIDEDLVFLPWELLYDGNDFLCLKHTVGRVVRVRSDGAAGAGPVSRAAAGDMLRMLVLADPTNDLACAYDEGQHIKNHLGRRRGRVEVDFKSSSVERVYVRKNIREYDVVHFAGHCVYDPVDRNNTGWVLKDGRFTAQDVLAMNPSARLPALIFSNACQSALVGGPAVEADGHSKNYSLASAFLYSGVKHYLGAVRRIEDAAGRHFACAFYENLAGGISVGESVRLSRLKIIGTYGREAILWAGYVLYGNPADCLIAGAPAAKRRLSIRARNPQRPAGSVLSSRRMRVTGAAAALAVGGWLASSVPTLKPDAYLLYARGRQHYARGENEAALKAGEGAIRKDPAFLPAYPLAADASQRLGETIRALKYYYEYYVQSEKRGDARHRSAAYSGLGWSYHNAGNYARADEFYSKAIELSVRTKDKLNEAVALRRLAVLRTDQKKNDEALALLTKSSELNRQFPRSCEHRYNLACDYFDIGLVFTNKDDYAAARSFYSRSRELFEELKCRRELSDCYFNLGELYLYEKQYRKAAEHYEQGLAIDLRHHNKFNLVTDYSMIGELRVEMEDFAGAQEAFLASIALARETGAVSDQAYSLHQLGLVYKKTARKAKAREAFAAARDLYAELDQQKWREMGEELQKVR